MRPIGCGVKFGGIQEISLADFPGQLCCILFTLGCNFRCPWCHNRDLVLNRLDPIPLSRVLSFLKKRAELLDGVTITGGEPLLQEGLDRFIEEVDSLGFKVKLDTNGSHPERLKDLMEKDLLDYVAMDVKAPLNKYHQVTGSKVDSSKVTRSIELIMDYSGEAEFRTTALPDLTEEDFREIGALIEGAEEYSIQSFEVPEGKGTLDPDYPAPRKTEDGKLQDLRSIAEEHVQKVEVK